MNETVAPIDVFELLQLLLSVELTSPFQFQFTFTVVQICRKNSLDTFDRVSLTDTQYLICFNQNESSIVVDRIAATTTKKKHN